MGESQNRYRATPKGKQKYGEHMRECVIEWRKRHKENSDYNPEEKRRKWRG